MVKRIVLNTLKILTIFGAIAGFIVGLFAALVLPSVLCTNYNKPLLAIAIYGVELIIVCVGIATLNELFTLKLLDPKEKTNWTGPK
jgi:uncharacterized membrane protein YuzA (DUF378 family)